MKNISSFFLLGFFLFSCISHAQQLSHWNGLSFYAYEEDTIEYPYDGNNPVGKILVVNDSTANSPSGISVTVTCDAQAEGLLNSFPNGGKLAVLEPGDSSLVVNWFLDLLQHPDSSFVNDEYRTVTVSYDFDDGNSLLSAERNYVIHYLGNNPTPSGSTVVSGKIVYPDLGAIGGANLKLGTLNWKGTSVSLTFSAIDTGYTFSTTIPDRNTWYLHVGGDVSPKTYKIDRSNSQNIRIEVDTAIGAPDFDYELIASPQTNTGFWRGAYSESELSVALFPGQENWIDDDTSTAIAEDSMYRVNSKIYKYKMDGTLMWEYSTGWETWGGDMSRDGAYVVYALYTGNSTQGYSNSTTKVELLDGLTGTPLWSKTNDPLYESYEVSLSNTNSYVAVGTTGTGQVSLLGIDSGNVLWTIPDTSYLEYDDGFGQVRRMAFDETDQYLYFGSGDNYLRKVRVSDGALIWRACVGGWPFVNGLSLSKDGNYLAVGMKSAMVAYVRASDGKIMWTHDSGNFDDAHLSPDGNYFATYSGKHFETATGEFIGRSGMNAVGQFTHDSKYMCRMPGTIEMYYVNGSSDPCYTSTDTVSIGGGSGEQPQWMCLMANDSLAVVTARDMGNPPQTGIAFYRSKNVVTSIKSTDKPASQKKLFVYPNPNTNSAFNVKLSCNTTDQVEVSIVDVLGREIGYQIQNISMDNMYRNYYLSTEGITTGTYFVSCCINGQKLIDKLIILK